MIKLAKVTIAVSKETRDTLREISKRSGLDIKDVVDEWVSQLRKVIDNLKTRRINLMSIASYEKTSVKTFFSELVVGSMILNDSFPEEKEFELIKSREGLE